MGKTTLQHDSRRLKAKRGMQKSTSRLRSCIHARGIIVCSSAQGTQETAIQTGCEVHETTTITQLQRLSLLEPILFPFIE